MNAEKLTNRLMLRGLERKHALFPLSISAKLGRSKVEESGYLHDIYGEKHKISKFVEEY
jgi:hypothetical protein